MLWTTCYNICLPITGRWSFQLYYLTYKAICMLTSIQFYLLEMRKLLDCTRQKTDLFHLVSSKDYFRSIKNLLVHWSSLFMISASPERKPETSKNRKEPAITGGLWACSEMAHMQGLWCSLRDFTPGHHLFSMPCLPPPVQHTQPVRLIGCPTGVLLCPWRFWTDIAPQKRWPHSSQSLNKAQLGFVSHTV